MNRERQSLFEDFVARENKLCNMDVISTASVMAGVLLPYLIAICASQGAHGHLPRFSYHRLVLACTVDCSLNLAS